MTLLILLGGAGVQVIAPPVPVPFELIVAPDDFSLTVPADDYSLLASADDLSLTVPVEAMGYVDYYASETLTDETGNVLTDENGEILGFTILTTANVFVLHIPPDDLSVTVPDEVPK